MLIEIKMPKLSPTMTDGTIVKWLKKEGERVAEGDTLCEIATDKSTIEYNALDAGYLQKILRQEGERVALGEVIAIIVDTLEAKSDCKHIPVPTRIIATPLAKKIAKDRGLDLTSVQGSGPQGRIVAKDLEQIQPISASTPRSGAYEEVPLTPIRRVIGERLLMAKTTIPHYYIADEVRSDPLMEMRAQLKEAGLKITYNDFILRATALALKEHPDINTGFHPQHQTLIRFKTIDISLAVSIPDGLITPILFHADHKDIFTLSDEVKRLALRAKANQLKPEEYQGGSFTLSNLGLFGIQSFQAIINPPQAAILAVGGMQAKALVHQGELIPGHTMHLTLSLDHRVIDGAEGAKFLTTLKHFILNPTLLLI